MEQVQGFFSSPCDNMYAAPLYAKYINENWVAAESHPRESIVIAILEKLSFYEGNLLSSLPDQTRGGEVRPPAALNVFSWLR